MRITLLTSCLLTLAFAAPAAEYYVAASNGRDTNDGSSPRPFQTISRAVKAAIPGDTVWLRAGTYRETVIFQQRATPEKPLLLAACPNEKVEIKGSDPVSGWQKHNDKIWKKENWAFNSQQVFVDGKVMAQIGFSSDSYPQTASDGNWMIKRDGNGVSDMRPGSFYYDRQSKTLYLYPETEIDPNQVLIEASTRMYLIDANAADGIHVRGISFRHSNTSAHKQGGAAIEFGNNCLLEKCDVQWCDFSGVSVGYKRKGGKVIDCKVSNNGNSGIGATLHGGFVIRNCQIMNNNYRHFNPTWHAGGIKAIPDSWGIIENCAIGNNQGTGVWFDYCRSANQSLVRNNRIFNNHGMGGIFIEVSRNIYIENNLISGNHLLGVRLTAAADCTVQHNLIAETEGFIALDLEGPRPKIEDCMKNNKIVYNVIMNNRTKFDIHLAEPGPYMVNNICDYNTYIRPDGFKLRLTNGGKGNWKELLVTGDWKQWQKKTGADLNSIFYTGLITTP